MNTPRTLLIICVSLSDQHDRRTFMTSQLNAIGVPFQIMDAVRVNLDAGWPEAYDRKARLRYTLSDLRAGEVGCYLSHQQCWQLFLKSDNELCCILEDDVRLHKDFLQTVEALCESRDSWDLVRLFAFFPCSSKKLQRICGDHYLVDYLVKQPNGTQGYLVNRHAAQKLLEHTATMIHAIDDSIDREWEHRLRMRGLEPAVVSHNDFASTIGKRSEVKKTLAGRFVREYFRMASNLRKQIWGFRKRLYYLFHRDV